MEGKPTVSCQTCVESRKIQKKKKRVEGGGKELRKSLTQFPPPHVNTHVKILGSAQNLNMCVNVSDIGGEYPQWTPPSFQYGSVR